MFFICSPSFTTEKDGKDETEENDEPLYDPNADEENEKWVETDGVSTQDYLRKGF